MAITISDTGTIRRMRYGTEDGAVHVGDEHFDVALPNGYGDGFFDLFIYENRDEWDAYEEGTLDAKRYPTWHFFTSFASDVPTFVDGAALKPGRYGAYYRDGDVALVAWTLFE